MSNPVQSLYPTGTVEQAVATTNPSTSPSDFLDRRRIWSLGLRATLNLLQQIVYAHFQLSNS